MIRFKILQCDDGATPYLGWAKGKALALIHEGIHEFSRSWAIADVTVAARSVKDRGDCFVSLRLSGSGATFNRLHNWPATGGVRNFRLAALPADPDEIALIPPEKIVNAVGMAPIGGILSFTGLTKNDPQNGAPYGISWVSAKLEKDFAILAATEKWMLRQWLAQAILVVYVDRMAGDPGELQIPPLKPSPLAPDELAALSFADQAAYQDALSYWRPALTINYDDCFMSEPFPVDDAGTLDAWILLGAFRDNHGVAPADNQEFRGVTVRYSTLVACNTSPVSFQCDLSSFGTVSAAVKVFQAAEYTRLRPGSYFFGATIISIGSTQVATSPFVVTYAKGITTQLRGGGALTNPFDNATKSEQFTEVHSLGADGLIVVKQLDTTSIERPASWSSILTGDNPINQTVTESSVNCDLYFFTGDALVKIGDYSYTGASFHQDSGVGSGSNGTITRRAAVPMVSNAAVVDEYLPEFGIVRVGESLFTDLNDRHFIATATRPSGSIGNGVTLFTPGPVPSLTHSDTGFSGFGPRITQDVATTFGMIDGQVQLIAARRSGLPIPTIGGGTFNQGAADHIHGVFWYRSGPTGVLVITVSTFNAAARALDCVKYQNVFNKVEGYRLISHGAGRFGDIVEPNYEPLPTILARIVAKTHVVMNNFASQALFPWINPPIVNSAFAGIIL